MKVRLQKYLSQAGIASRRESEKLILNGFIKVNDVVVKKLGVKIDVSRDIIKYKDKKINMKNGKKYIMLNKPKGYITTVKDQFGRATVLDLLNEDDKLVYPIGRLDYSTSGLLLLTNDGDLTYKLTHPKHKVYKTYIAHVIGILTKEKLNLLRNGVVIDNKFKTSKAKVKLIKKDFKISIIKISIYEGKNRQIRKMFDNIGHKVVSLERISIDRLSLGNLNIGNYRHLNNEEIYKLKLLQ